jgi:hypothetical protein
MARKRYKPEEIVAKLRQVDVLVSQGQNGGRNPPDRRERGDVLSVAPGVRWAEDRTHRALVRAGPRGCRGERSPRRREHKVTSATRGGASGAVRV